MVNAQQPAGRWTRAALAAIGSGGARWPVLPPSATAPAIPGLDLWDMWPIADVAGRTLVHDGRQWWFFLAVPRRADPEMRHDGARIHLTSHGADGWRDHGPALPDGFTPGSREWSGSALLDGDGETLTLFFTATGDRDGGPHFRQRLFETVGRLVVTAGEARCEGWTTPVETVAADGCLYAPADQAEPEGGTIRGFRDPGYFRDPADGAEYLLFTGSAAGAGDPLDGVIGWARRGADGWVLLPPLVTAIGVASELERAHLVARDGRYYLFWTTQGRRIAVDLVAPTGLYGLVADRLAGPWRAVNGNSLVAGNPGASPWQAYCWWVTGDGEVLSFVDYPGDTDPQAVDAGERRRRFGGTPAPFARLCFDGDRVTIA